VLQNAVLLAEDATSVRVATAPVLDLALDAGSSPVAPGASFEYVLGFGNESAAGLSALSLRLPVPPGTALISASDSGVLVGSAVEWSIPDLPAGQGSTRRARFQAPAGAAEGSILRAIGAEIFPAAAPAQSARANLATHLAATAPLALAVIANPDPVKSGEMLEIELTVANRGGATLPGVVVDLRVPDGVLSSPLANSSGAACPAVSSGGCDVPELATWSIGDLAPGQGTTLVLAPRRSTAASVNGGLLELRARARSANGALAVASTSALGRATPRFDLATWVDRDPVAPGQSLTYSVAYSNQSAAAITGGILELPLPADFAPTATSAGGVFSGGVLTWTLPSLAAGAGDILRARVAVPPGTPPGSLLLPGPVRLRDPVAPLEDARASALSRVQTAPSLTARVVVTPDPVRNFEDPHVEVVVANLGASPIENTSVELRIADEASATLETTYIEDGGTCPNVSASCITLEFVRWSLGTLQPGQARTVAMYQIMTSALAGDLITFNADVRATGHHASGSAATIVDFSPAFDLLIDAERDPVVPGQEAEVVLRFGNDGAVERTGRLEVPLPEGTTLVSASNGGQLAAGLVSWELGAFAPQEGGSRRLRLRLGPTAGLLDVAHARLFDPAASLEAARASLVAQLEAAPGLSVTSDLSPDPVARSGHLDVSFQVRNETALPLSGLVGQIRFPHQIGAFAEALLTPAGGVCLGTVGGCNAEHLASWTLGSLGSGSSLAVSAPPQVVANAVLGGHLRFRGRFLDPAAGDAIARRSALVGILADRDSDEIPNLDDNCPYFPNPSQQDTDADGRGNACECSDQNGDGRNTVADLVAINQAIFNPALVTPLCDGNGDSACSVSDIVAANLEIFSPTSTSRCARQPVPGP
jgi:hypothetical protein